MAAEAAPPMADGFRSKHGLAHLWDLFRNGQIFEESEQRQISSLLVPELNHSLHGMHQAAWLLRKRVRDLHHFTAADMQGWGIEFRKIHRVEDVAITDGSGALGAELERYQVFLSLLHRDPSPLADGFVEFVALLDDNFVRLRDVLRVLLFDFFGGATLRDETSATCFLSHLAAHHATHPPVAPAVSAFALALPLQLGESLDGMTYLRTALAGPALAVLEDDELDLEIEPTMLWSRLSDTVQESLLPGKNAIPVTPSVLTAIVDFKTMLDEANTKLIRFCLLFVDSLTKTVATLPTLVRHVLVEFAKSLAAQQPAAPVELSIAMVLMPAICAAIRAPDAAGVIVDLPLSMSARRNMELVALVLGAAGCHAYGCSEAPYLGPIFKRLKQTGEINLTPFFTAVAVPPPTIAALLPPLPGSTPVVVATVDSIITVQEVLTRIEKKRDRDEPIIRVLRRLPRNPRDRPDAPHDETWELQVVCISLVDAVEPAPSPAKDKVDTSDAHTHHDHEGDCEGEGEGEGNDGDKNEEEPDDNAVDDSNPFGSPPKAPTPGPTPGHASTPIPIQALGSAVAATIVSSSDPGSVSGPSHAAVLQAVSDLVAALTRLDSLALAPHTNLGDLVQAVRSRAVLEGHVDLATSLATARTLLESTPLDAQLSSLLEAQLAASVAVRAQRLQGLIESRRCLLVAEESARKRTTLLRGAIRIAEKHFWGCIVNVFLNKLLDKQPFLINLSSIEAADDRARSVNQFLASLREQFKVNSFVQQFTDEEREPALETLERGFYSSIYRDIKSLQECDAINDQTFHQHVSKNLSYVTPSHPSIQINENYLHEAPWPAAQQCLRRLRAHCDPRDKIDCIVECCQTLVTLLMLSGQPAGADDLFPVLVFVILKANPPHLLSSIQYIKYFGDDLLATGEASYWWAQFYSAVRFVHSIDDRTDLRSPATSTSDVSGPAGSAPRRVLQRSVSSSSEADDMTDC